MRRFLRLIMIAMMLVVSGLGASVALATEPEKSDNFKAVIKAIKEAPEVGRMNLVATPKADHVAITNEDDPATEVGRIPTDRWVEFVRVAVAEAGLRDFATVQTPNGDTIIVLGFAHPESTVRLADTNVKLTERFWSRMEAPGRFSEKREAGKRRKIILIHDPHYSVAARFHLVEGMRALIEANPDKRFAFLVEGDYTPKTEKIPTSIVAGAFVGGMPDHTQVLHLLKNTWIDAPLAYRLLYPVPEVDSLAIDDRSLVQKSIEVRRTVDITLDPKATFAFLRRLSAMKVELAKADVHSDDGLLNLLDVILYNSDFTTNEDETSCRRVAGASVKVADELASRNGPIYADAAASLRKLAVQATTYDLALQRNATMEQRIREYADKNPNVIPIAFIGNFHTKGLIRRLHEDFDYAVFEPYEMQDASGEALKEFEDRLVGRSSAPPKSPAAGGDKSGELKIWVSPPPEYVPQMKKELVEFGRTFADQQRQAQLAGIAVNRSSDIVVAAQELSSVRKRNVNPMFGGGGKLPPSDGVFGGFDGINAPDGGESAWYLPPADEKWDRRVAFMKETLVRPPLLWDKDPRLTAVKFSRGANGSVAAFALYEGKTDAARFFDNEGAEKSLALIIALPKYKAESKAQIHFLRLSLDTRKRKQEKYHG
jgi:hypothetical protein